MATATSPSALGRSTRRSSPLARRERNWGLIFLSPWIAGFLIFFLIPMVASLIFSFMRYNLVRPAETTFVGLGNWRRMFTDPLVRQSLVVTGRFLLVSVPLHLAFALGLAVLLNAKALFGRNVFRTLFYMPVMVPAVAGAVIWRGVLNTQSGWINRSLEAIGITGPGWFNDARWVIPGLTILGVWGVGNAMLVLLAGLQNVPTELYDAAKVDGAGPLYSFFKITLPMVSPIIFYNLVLSLIGAFQYFLPTFVLFNGNPGPDNAANFYMLNLYKEAFVYFDMGYASALAWGMFIVALVVTMGLFASAKRWVYYAAGD